MYVAPHTEFFIGDQLTALKGWVRGFSVLIPTPRFSGIAKSLPDARGRFESLRRADSSMRGPLGPHIVRAKYFGLPGSTWLLTSYSSAARSSLRTLRGRSGEFDVVHAHFIGVWGYIGRAMKLEFQTPFVLTAHGGDAYKLPFTGGARREVAEEIVSAADRLIAVSRPISENLAALGARPDRVRIIPNGYDSSLFYPMAMQQARSRLGLPADKKIVLAVASLVSEKGHEYLMESMKRVVEANSQTLLAIVGGGELAGPIQASAARLGLGGNVLFAGPRPHEEIASWICASDLLALASVEEGSPTVLTEAMACGKPVVATAIGGVPDLVIEGRTGRLVAPRDVGGLATAIQDALDSPWDEEAILETAKGYSWDALAPRLVEVYREVAGV